MVWIELRTKDVRYDTGWNTTESIWAPTRKKRGGRQGYWQLVNSVTKGDVIFHLRYYDGHKRFIGYSVAQSDGYITRARPKVGEFDESYSIAFYKADLTDFQAFDQPIELETFFTIHNNALRTFYSANRDAGGDKDFLFYVIQNEELQCQFGAYLSEFGETLQQLLFNSVIAAGNDANIATSVATASSLALVPVRYGQNKFSDNVKSNFDNKCCYPQCNIVGREFVVASHIARWVDDAARRGDTSNGLCLCPNHDRAFEKGYFTIDNSYKIIFPDRMFDDRQWLSDILLYGEKIKIKRRRIDPSGDAIQSHWTRIGYQGQ